MAGFSNAQLLAGFGTNRFINQPDIPTWGGPITDPSAYGTQPVIPAPRSMAPAATQEAMSLGNQVYNQLPGYGASVANIGSNIQSETAGQLPEDVKREIAQAAAERGVATGQGAGGPNNNAAYLRALGLDSLNLTNMGQQNLTSFLPTLPGAAVANSGRFSVSPELAQNAAETGAVYRAAPNPAAAAAAGLAAARSGLAAGSAGGTGGGFIPPSMPTSGGAGMFATPNMALGPTGAGTGGTYYGGVYYPPGTSPTGSLDLANGLNKKYGDLVGGGPGDYADEGESNYGEPSDYYSGSAYDDGGYYDSGEGF